MNVLKPTKQATIVTLLARGTTQTEVARITGIDRKTVMTCSTISTIERAIASVRLQVGLLAQRTESAFFF